MLMPKLIISKVIAVGVKSILPNISYHNQTGLKKDRYTGETVRSILTSSEFTDNESIRAIWIFVDYESFRHHPIEWHYLFDCLKALNFRSELIVGPYAAGVT